MTLFVLTDPEERDEHTVFVDGLLMSLAAVFNTDQNRSP